MRPRINNNLVWTTSESETKINYIKKNKNPKPKVVKFVITTFGKRKYISLKDYLRLQKAGIECDIIEE